MPGMGPAGCWLLGIVGGGGTEPGSAKLPVPILATGPDDCSPKAVARTATLMARSMANPMTFAIVR